MKKIGIPANILYSNPQRSTYPVKSLSFIENDMANYLAQKGILPILIPYLHNKTVLQNILSEMDGFVFSGGVDMSPESYGELPIGKWKGDKIRDDFELGIFDFAMQQNKPILAICRGCQLMNVYFGGTLYQDIPTQLEQAITHYEKSKYDKNYHLIECKPETLLADLYADVSQPKVNSVHHQAVKDLGEHLRVLATSPEDGLIEAIQWKNEQNWVVGVQWHPEFSHTLGNQVIDGEVLYRRFIESL